MSKEIKVVVAALVVAFALFVVGYHGGKHLAKVENAAQSSAGQR